MSADTSVARRPARFRLYLPFLLLALLAAGWSVAWYVIRDQVVGGLDAWVEAEAKAGRTWTCPDRSVAGYPFRIEIRCPTLNLSQPDLTARTGPLLIVRQAYDWRRTIAEVTAPLDLRVGNTAVSATWRLLQASVATPEGGIARLALVADDAVTRFVLADATRFDITSRHLELHARPDPAVAGAVDLALDSAGTILPLIDSLIGATEPADVTLLGTVTEAGRVSARTFAGELERWRQSGGEVRITRASLASGSRRVQANGRATLDAEHRPQGEINASARELGGVVGRYTGSGLGRLIGALAGGGRKPAPAPGANPNEPPLDPLPPVRLEGGRLFVGPISIPGVTVPPIY